MSSFLSKEYVIVDKAGDLRLGRLSQASREFIKGQLLEMIGEDEVFIDIPVLDHLGNVKSVISGESYTPYMVAKNDLRKKLRQKIEEL